MDFGGLKIWSLGSKVSAFWGTGTSVLGQVGPAAL